MKRATLALFALLAGIGLLGGPASAAPNNTLREIRTWSLGDVTRIALEVDGELDFRYDRLADPPRLFFDLQNTSVGTLRGNAATITVGDPLVRQVRVGILQKGVARVVVDLFEMGDFSVSQLTNPSRLVVEFRRGAGTLPPAVPEPHIAPPPSVSASAPAAPKLTRRERARQQALRRPVIELPASSRRKTPTVPPVWTLAHQPRVTPRVALSRIPEPPAWELHIPDRPVKTLARAARPVVTVAPPPPEAPAAVASPVAAKAAPPLAAKVAPEPIEPFLDARPAQQTRLGDRSLTRALGLKLRRVVLDAGHGGHDTGTVSKGGLREKDLVLDVTRRLGALIEERLGSEVIYTRDDDTFVQLEDRTAFANRQKADLFLSIHANSSAARSAAGMETFYLNFTTSKDDLDVAARENASSAKSIHDLSDLVRRITLQDKVEESREFAGRVQSAGFELTKKTHGTVRNRGVKKAPFVVLIGARMPSILVEIGFLTNSKEESLMRKAEHRDKIAEALFKGVARYADSLSHFRVAQTGSSRSSSESQ